VLELKIDEIKVSKYVKKFESIGTINGPFHCYEIIMLLQNTLYIVTSCLLRRFVQGV